MRILSGKVFFPLGFLILNLYKNSCTKLVEQDVSDLLIKATYLPIYMGISDRHADPNTCLMQYECA